ncbi:hypothetical protein, conserved [Eimeria maxima]|uniref:Protein geranylgeranyltransferase type II n=1 Tax=Eimeria maxima TaxID=5804 RepID=U6M467_EIMMA|nr:hypothetical protein, conserved [Eimeria maxima]CDJ58811.1 hypothetical protein, conserved [Eimeria maxima]
MDYPTDKEEMEVAVIAAPISEMTLLNKQHQLYQEDAIAQQESSSSSSSSNSSSPLLQHPDFLAANAAAIAANSGDYTSWYLRRKFLTLKPEHINADELRFCREVCSESLKNYQAWFHRRWRYLPMFEQYPTNESLVAFLLGCLKAAAAAAKELQQQQQQGQEQQQGQDQQQGQEQQPKELQEAIEALLTAAAAAAAAGEGAGSRLGLEIGVTIDEMRGDLRAAHK